tara:strand:+ start:206 stop:403 length:198 start_codon:yes stop_codon:yes gene_type:complete
MTTQSAEKKKRKQVCVQISPELKDWLVAEGKRNGRSLQKEVEFRLEWSRREDMRLGLHGRKGRSK